MHLSPAFSKYLTDYFTIDFANEFSSTENILDATTFCKLFDMYGDEAAGNILDDANAGIASSKAIEDWIFVDQTKEEYSNWLKNEYKDLE